MERPHDPFVLLVGIREDIAELRMTTTHLTGDVSDLRQDVRRLDHRTFQLLLLQLGGLAMALASLVAVLVS